MQGIPVAVEVQSGHYANTVALFHHTQRHPIVDRLTGGKNRISRGVRLKEVILEVLVLDCLLGEDDGTLGNLLDPDFIERGKGVLPGKDDVIPVLVAGIKEQILAGNIVNKADIRRIGL